jgi:hypothetical protein
MTSPRITLGAVASAIALALVVRNAGAEPTGFAFLEVPAGARASALDGAYASLAEGIDAAFWNPAGLAATHGIQVTASHYEFLDQLRHAQFGLAGKLFGGGMAGTLRAMYSEPITERDAVGNEIGTFGSHDLEFALSYGRSLSANTRVGGSAQVVRERIADVAATTWAVGGGATWDPAALPRLRLSASVHNLGPAGAYDLDGVKGQPVRLPEALQAGLSYGIEPRGIQLRGSLEGRFTRGRAGIGMLGAELAHESGAALRAGVRVNDESNDFSVGVGYSTRGLRFDYAFVPYRLDLGDTHRFSLTTQF